MSGRFDSNKPKRHNKTMSVNVKHWAILAVPITFILLTVYIIAHQLLRQTANDPLIQSAEDWAATVETSVNPNRLDLGNFIDPSQSYQDFGIVYDQDGKIVASSVSAPSNMSQPDGVFDSVDAAPNNEVRYTWQPATGDRYAAVMKRANLQSRSYYILAGRNLKLIEQHQSQAMWLTFFGWLTTLVAAFVAYNVHLVGHVVRRYREKRKTKKGKPKA